MQIEIFTFNPFQENTYILYDETNSCVIIDPGCFDQNEQSQLVDFIDSKDLTPTALLNTHCHIDHVLGNKFVSEKYGLSPISHKGEHENLANQVMVSQMYGLPYDPSPDITQFLQEGEQYTFGNTVLDIIYAPGHSPAHILFHHKESKQIIGGDVLFRDSIGRTDLPGGNHELLLRNITEKLFILDPETVVYPGHGPHTSIGYEIKNNPFLK